MAAWSDWRHCFLEEDSVLLLCLTQLPDSFSSHLTWCKSPDEVSFCELYDHRINNSSSENKTPTQRPCDADIHPSAQLASLTNTQTLMITLAITLANVPSHVSEGTFALPWVQWSDVFSTVAVSALYFIFHTTRTVETRRWKQKPFCKRTLPSNTRHCWPEPCWDSKLQRHF